EEYELQVKEIISHIQRGDIYEMNFCQEFYATHCSLDPLPLFIALHAHSPVPFAAFFRDGDRYALSASPERFLARRGQRLISQPIKGTRSRAEDPDQDRLQKESLSRDEKEKTENIMIVDLVRNDLTKSAKE